MAADTPVATNSPAHPARSRDPAPATRSSATNQPTSHFLFFKWHQKPKNIPPPPPLTLTPTASRLSDEALSNDRRYFEELSRKLATLEHPAASPRLYTWTQAQAWLSLAREEHGLDDTTGLIEEAVHRVKSLIAELEDPGGVHPAEVVIPRQAKRVRPDLWDLAAQWKQHARFTAGQEWVARMEVQLVLAGHREQQGGWRDAMPSLEQAERSAGRAQVAIEGAEALERRIRAWQKAEPIQAAASSAAAARQLAEVQSRIAALNAAGVPLNDYFLAKAQAWLDLALAMHTANDRTGMLKEAATEARQLVSALENRARDLPGFTRIPKSARKVRADLWKLAESLKRDPHFEQGAAAVARLEVQLVWAGHEEQALGWRAAKPLIQLAEEYAAEARAQIAPEPATSPGSTSSHQSRPAPLQAHAVAIGKGIERHRHA